MKPALSLSFQSEVDPAEWDGALQGTNATCFHAARWQSFASTSVAGRTPLFLKWCDAAGSPVAWATAAGIGTHSFMASTFRRTLLLDALPAVVSEDSPATYDLLSVMLADARDRGFVELQLEGYGSEVDKEALEVLGFSTTPRFEFLVEVGDGETACWDGMESKRRNKIRRARRDGVKVLPLGPTAAADAFVHLQKETTARIRERGGAIGDPPPPEVTHRRLSRLADGELGMLRAAQVDGAIVAVAAFGCFNGRAYYLESAASEAGLRAQAPSLLLWEAIAELADHGFETLNLGGCSGLAEAPESPEHGLFVFKRDFGATIVQSAAGKAILLPLRFRAGQILRRGLGALRKLRGLQR